MVKIRLFKFSNVQDRQFRFDKGEVSISAIPSPRLNRDSYAEIIYLDKDSYYVSFIVYQPKIYDDDERVNRTLIFFIKNTIQEDNERLMGIVSDLNQPTIKIHPHSYLEPLPFLHPSELNVNLHKIPNTNREFISLGSQDLYKFRKTTYSDFQNDVSCELMKVKEDDIIWEDLLPYGTDALL